MASNVTCFGEYQLDLNIPQIMGVLNVTPDSFSDGGRFNTLDSALAQAVQMVQNGAAIIDVGGESTRPGADPVSEQQELDRVIPVVESIRDNLDVVVSVDTSTPAVMRAALELGVGLINDVRALERNGAVEAVKNSHAAICLMHMKGTPENMQDNPDYGDVVDEVKEYLQLRVDALVHAGVSRERLIIDPGFGFGKTLEHNLSLLRNLGRFHDLELPVLVGMSRKSMLGAVLDKPVDQRMIGGIAAACIAVMNGASIIRTHDVPETMDAVKVLTAVSGKMPL